MSRFTLPRRAATTFPLPKTGYTSLRMDQLHIVLPSVLPITTSTEVRLQTQARFVRVQVQVQIGAHHEMDKTYD